MNNKIDYSIKLEKPIIVKFTLLEHEPLLKPIKDLMQESVTCINFMITNDYRTQIDFLSKNKKILSLYLYDKFSIFNNIKMEYEIKSATKYDFKINRIKPINIYKEIKILIGKLKSNEIIRISQFTDHSMRLSNIFISHGDKHANEYYIDYKLLGSTSFDGVIKNSSGYVPYYGNLYKPIWLLFINTNRGYKETILKLMSHVIRETKYNDYELIFRLDTYDMFYADFILHIDPVVVRHKNGIRELQSPVDIYSSIETCFNQFYNKQICGLVIKLNNNNFSLGVVKIKGKKVIRKNMTLEYLYDFQLLNAPELCNAKCYTHNNLLKSASK